MGKIIYTLLTFLSLSLYAGTEEKHLFILSGQSNMTYLKPESSFIPALKDEFGGNFIVVKDDKPAQPIRRWYKKWKPASGEIPKNNGDLYDRLMNKVKKDIQGKKIASVTFIWMQGERDAKEKHGDVYLDSLKGLIKQLSDDLKRDDINFIIGRINDFSMNNKSHKHWTKIREVQEKAAKEIPRAALVDTDDLNGRRNGIHATKEGFTILGERFAKKSIELIKKN